MKKIVWIVTILFVIVTLSGCEDPQVESPDDQEQIIENKMLENREILGVLSYFSSMFFIPEEVDASMDNFIAMPLSFESSLVMDKPETEINLDLEQVNIYIDKLKNFIEYGTEEFGVVKDDESDKEEFNFLLTIKIEGEEYLLYYNVDENQNITGEFVYGGEIFTIAAENSYLGSKEEDELSNEEKQYMLLIAKRGQDTISIEYEVKSEEDETKQLFSILSNIGGTVSSLAIEIKTEESEFVLTIFENEDEYTFKMDDEDDEFNYKLDYVVNDVKGKVRVSEKINEFGNAVYFYRVQERNVKFDIEMEDPDQIEDSESLNNS